MVYIVSNTNHDYNYYLLEKDQQEDFCVSVFAYTRTDVCTA